MLGMILPSNLYQIYIKFEVFSFTGSEDRKGDANFAN